jgi:hypothetical protein
MNIRPLTRVHFSGRQYPATANLLCARIQQRNGCLRCSPQWKYFKPFNKITAGTISPSKHIHYRARKE